MFKKERYDGTYIRNLNFFTQITPYVKPAQTDSFFIFKQEYDITKTMEFIKEKNATLTQVFLYATLRTITTMPKINRFISGLRYYQRNRIAFSFGNTDIVTMSFSPLLSFESFCFKMQNYASPFENKEDVKIDNILTFIKKLPRFLIKFSVWCLKFLDYHNGLPKSFINNLPYFSSLILTDAGDMVANSDTEIDYYHNFNIGNCGFFCTIGGIKNTDGRVKTRVSFTFDNRIADPVYCLQALGLLRDLTENPERLIIPHEWTTEQMVRLGLKEKELNNI